MSPRPWRQPLALSVRFEDEQQFLEQIGVTLPARNFPEQAASKERVAHIDFRALGLDQGEHALDSIVDRVVELAQFARHDTGTNNGRHELQLRARRIENDPSSQQRTQTLSSI